MTVGMCVPLGPKMEHLVRVHMIIIHAAHLDLHIGSVRKAHTLLLYELPIGYTNLSWDSTQDKIKIHAGSVFVKLVSHIERNCSLRPETEDWTCTISLQV